MIVNEFVYPLRVHIEDTDFAGVVYHANYLKFMDRARSEWAEKLGIGIDWQKEQQIYLPVRSVEMEFLKPARLNDKIEIVTSFKAIRPASLLYAQHLRLAASPDKILFKANIKLACVNASMEARALPESPILESIRRILT